MFIFLLMNYSNGVVSSGYWDRPFILIWSDHLFPAAQLTIWFLLVSPKRYGKFQIPSFTYILASASKILYSILN